MQLEAIYLTAKGGVRVAKHALEILFLSRYLIQNAVLVVGDSTGGLVILR